MFDIKTRRQIGKIAQRLGVPAAALLAVVEVESGGQVFAKVNGRSEPLIRFEGHYFDRLLRGKQKRKARAAGLAHPTAGKIKNPRSQAARWKLLDRAIRINRKAALASVSWGLGQVMGSHWKWLGYSSVLSLVNEARSGAAGQVKLMARYIEKADLVPALQRLDWISFARGYNGPGYKRNKYDTKMAQAYARYLSERVEVTLPKVEKADEVGEKLMFGARGQRVRNLQRQLTLKGYSLVADGLFGLITDRTVRQFQRDHSLAETGVVGQAEEALIFDAGSPLWTRLGRIKTVLAEKILRAAKRAAQPARVLRDRLSGKLRKGLLSIFNRLA